MKTEHLPNLLIIGANKAGTSSLHAYLAQHPDIFMSSPKEPMFFVTWGLEKPESDDPRYTKSVPYFYNELDQYEALFEKGKKFKIRGESSTAYLANPECAKKIHELIPDTKIIAVLRNPIDRAFSNYVMYRGWEIEKKSFEDAIQEELTDGRKDYPQGMRYLSLGNYSVSISEYKKYFPSHQMKIILYDDFLKNPDNILKEIHAFLGVDPNFIPNMNERHNVVNVRRFKANGFADRFLNLFQRIFRKIGMKKLSEKTENYRFLKLKPSQKEKKMLAEYYRNEIGELARIINKDLSNWNNRDL